MKNDAGANLNAWKKVLLVCTAAGAFAVPIAVGMLNAPRTHAQSIADETIGPPFTAVSVTPSAGGFAPTVARDGRFAVWDVAQPVDRELLSSSRQADNR